MKDYTDYQLSTGNVLRVIPDDDPMNPRTEWDNLGTMICFHKRYNLGDKHDHSEPDDFRKSLIEEYYHGLTERIDKETDKLWSKYAEGYTFSERQKKVWGEYDDAINAAWEKVCTKYLVILPLYLYDHSGITMNTTGFTCRWDSGQVGYIYIDKEKALKEYGGKIFSRQLKKRLTSYLEGEVEVYDQYLTGDVYGFQLLDPEGEEIDSSWGFFGSDPKENGMMGDIEGGIVEQRKAA